MWGSSTGWVVAQGEVSQRWMVGDKACRDSGFSWKGHCLVAPKQEQGRSGDNNLPKLWGRAVGWRSVHKVGCRNRAPGLYSVWAKMGLLLGVGLWSSCPHQHCPSPAAPHTGMVKQWPWTEAAPQQPPLGLCLSAEFKQEWFWCTCSKLHS